MNKADDYFIDIIYNERKEYYGEEIRKLFTYPYLFKDNSAQYHIETIRENDIEYYKDRFFLDEQEIRKYTHNVICKVRDELIKVQQIKFNLKIYMLKETPLLKEMDFSDCFQDEIDEYVYKDLDLKNILNSKLLEFFYNQKYINYSFLKELLFESVRKITLKTYSGYIEDEIENHIDKYLITEDGWCKANKILERKIKLEKL
jgi:hypothetical protein